MGFFLPLITGTIWLFVLWRFVWPLPLAAGTRIGLALLLLLIAQYHWLVRAFFGSIASPELPQEALIALAWAFGVLLLLAMLSLVRDVLGLLLYLPWRWGGRMLLTSPPLTVLIGLAAVVLSAIGVWNAIRIPHIETLAITVPGLPASFDRYRIVQLTDTHASRLLPEYWQEAVVRRANSLHPDLIVITGDLADGSTTARARDVAPLQELHAPDGVLSIPGNHEYYSDYVDWMAAYKALGLNMLENEHVLIRRGDDTLAIAGLTDRQAIQFGQPAPDLQAALQGIPKGVPVILLDHRPEKAREHAEAGVAVQLSGHTHGGQILGGHWLTQLANAGFVSGLYHVGDMTLYVSNGAGLWNGLALRLGRPSEITQILLRPAP
ncbi:metallophosphoesterase [Castellaniella sp.]|uniref:metallophosphoesterase n=1 Tax=Castellaniella sp. TaxID=1955812 RepID=UPI00356159AF